MQYLDLDNLTQSLTIVVHSFVIKFCLSSYSRIRQLPNCTCELGRFYNNAQILPVKCQVKIRIRSMDNDLCVYRPITVRNAQYKDIIDKFPIGIYIWQLEDVEDTSSFKCLSFNKASESRAY